MAETPNGWDIWYSHWDQTQATQESGDVLDIVPYHALVRWGKVLQQQVTLDDHWIGYSHPEPMSLEDGMSIAFVLYDAGVDVDTLIEMLESFQPIDAPVALGIPLCWLTEPMDHIQDLLGMIVDASQIDPEVFDQVQQSVEAFGGELPVGTEEMLDLIRAMVISAASWLLEMNKILGDDGNQALRAWWQGRLIILLREALAPRRKRGRRKRQPAQADVPSAFQDLIQSLGLLGPDDASPNPDEPGD